MLAILEKDSGKFEDEVFVIKQSVIHDEWKKRKARQVLSHKKSFVSPMNGGMTGGGSPSKNMNKKSSMGNVNDGSRSQISRKGTSISKSGGGGVNILSPKESVSNL